MEVDAEIIARKKLIWLSEEIDHLCIFYFNEKTVNLRGRIFSGKSDLRCFSHSPDIVLYKL
jgi:hypothetical protein